MKTMHRALDHIANDSLVNMWIGWAVVFGLCALAVFVVWLSMVLSTKVRRSPYNWNLIYLILPDWFYTANCAITCALNASRGQYYSPTMCQWQSLYTVWAIGVNAWLNAVIAGEMLRLLRAYKPPSRRKITMVAIAVNVGVIILAVLGILNLEWLQTSSQANLNCVPLPFDQSSSLVFWLAFWPLWVGIPSVYVGYVAFMVWRHGLLPAQGQRRYLALYCARLIGIFLVLWGPILVLFYAFGNVDPWIVWVAGLLAHVQTCISAILATTKPDIGEAVRQTVTCQWYALQPYDMSWLSPRWVSTASYIDTPMVLPNGEYVDETGQESTKTCQSAVPTEGVTEFDEPTEFEVRETEADESHLPVAPFDFDDEESRHDDLEAP